jgi:hypothetical protein
VAVLVEVDSIAARNVEMLVVKKGKLMNVQIKDFALGDA